MTRELKNDVVGSDSILRNDFLYGAARAFFASAWGDWEGEEGRFHGGKDLCEIAPEAPPLAYALAGELWAKLEELNRKTAPCGVYSLAEQAEVADDTKCEIDGEEFGHYLAMQAMGHGVSWFDDHVEFPLEIPRIECSCMTFDEATYK